MKTNCIKYLSGLLFLLSLTSGGCTSENKSAPDPLMLNCWTNAFEEEGQNNIRIFRPCATHTFPAARYRNTFTLKENGVVEYSVLAPNDAHTIEEGKWSYDPQTKKLRISNNENVPVYDYEVLEINEDLLRLKQ